MEGFEIASLILPVDLRRAALRISPADQTRAEEFRLRAGCEPTILLPEGESIFSGLKLKPRDLESTLEIATGASVYSSADSVRRGFVTVKGGCRVGLCGTAIVEGNIISGIKSLSSLAIRIPREVQGCADGIFRELQPDGFEPTIIISPPGAGKTTLLRELVRLLSTDGHRVSLADERGEVAAVWDGTPQFDVGPRTDVLTGAPKAEGAMLMLRAMNPEIIAMDEITAPEDVSACERAANCGVRLLATAHGEDAEDLRKRPLYRKLLEAGIFRKAVVIVQNRSERRYEIGEL